MKTLVFRHRNTSVWLHMENIIKIRTHKYAHYTETMIISTNHRIKIDDHYHGNFIDLLYEFIESDETLREINVVDMTQDDDYTFFRMLDWVSQAMGEK